MRVTNHLRLLSGVAIGTMAIATPQGAAAQDAPEAEDAAPKGEIIVTALKRETPLQKAPISLAVVSGEAIGNYKITDLTDLQSFVPNLTVQKTFGNWAVRVRGLGSGVTNIAFDSSVSIFNDGLYCGRSRCLEMGYFDVGTVEVARGPQGALFGKSTVAGAISVTSARPTRESGGYATIGTELEHGGYYAKAAVNGAVSDTFRVRLAGMYDNLDGDIDNTFLNKEDGGREAFAIRGSFEWDITPDVRLWAKAETGDVFIDGNRIQMVKPGPLVLARSGVDPANIETKLDDKRNVSTGSIREEFDDSRQSGFAAQLDVGLFGGHQLQLVTGHWKLRYDNHVDVDGVPESLLNTRLREDYKQTSFEARLVSPSGGTFEYIIGGLYHTSITKTGQFSPFFPNFYKTVGVPSFVVDAVFGGVGAAATGGDRRFERDTDTYSAYAQLTFNPTDRLSIIGDVRYTEEKQRGRAQAVNGVMYDGYTFTAFPGAPFQSNPEFILTQTRKDDSLDPSIRIRYEVTPDVNVYAAFSQGSKPGGLKANDGALGAVLLAKADAAFLAAYTDLTALPADLNDGVELKQGNGVFDFEDEKAKNYEVGTKMVFAGGDVRLNLTAFWTDFTNLQTSVYDGSTQAFLIGNAASARIKGVELDGSFQAGPYLTLTASGALIDPKFRTYEGTQCTKAPDDTLEDPTCTSGNGSLSGRRIERAPKFEGNFGASWNSPIGDNLNLIAGADVYYSSGLYIRQDFDPDGYQKGFAKFNARLGIETEDGWALTVIGRNLTDKRTIQHAFAVLSEFASVSAGRSVSVELTKRF